jgi:hypothetical protein
MLIGTALLVLSSVTNAAPVVYTDEALYLAELATLGGSTVHESFEDGTGIFTALDIPYTPYSFAAGNLNMDIQADAIEISGNGNYHDMGLDITLRFSQPLSPTQATPIDTDPNQSFFECCGNGFKDQPFQSGRIIPSTFLVGDFDADWDTDGMDFLKWQKGEVSSPPLASDLTAWEANFGAPLAAFSTTVPEPSSLLLAVIAGIVSGFRRQRV